jgi:hypothetical protein
MFIRKTTHTDNKSGKKYCTCKLVESIRTERGPRQRPILNLGAKFSLPKQQWKELANRIETIISGQLSFFRAPPQIEELAQRLARKIIATHGQSQPAPVEEQSNTDFQSVDVNSIENEQIRSVGAESVVLAAIQELELDSKLQDLGLNRPAVDAAIGVITARLLAPASERATHNTIKRLISAFPRRKETTVRWSAWRF